MSASPQQQFEGRTVLLTGALGFLGSVVLEQLLRLTNVKKVYLLVRSKKGKTAAERVEALLCGPLFNLLHKHAAVDGGSCLAKVQAVDGDLLQPGLGLSSADAAMLEQQVDVVLHSAASIELEADIHDTLRTNYFGTAQLMQLASKMSYLRAFVHVSTFFTSNHQPRNSLVAEKVYTLELSLDGGCTTVNRTEFVAALMEMDSVQANATAQDVMKRQRFGSTYAFGKNLTEQLVQDTLIKPGVHKAIVRPSLISSMAGAPYPGFIQGYAGAGGYIMAYALGFFQGLSSVAYGSDTILDLIPVDTVAAVVITAAAAAAADYGKPGGISCDAQTPAVQQQPQQSSSSNASTTIYHACSSHSHPLTITYAFNKMADFWTANPPPLRLPLTQYVRVTRKHVPTEFTLQWGHMIAGLKVSLLSVILRLAGQSMHAQKLQMGLKAHMIQNSLPLAASMQCCVDNVRALKARLPAAERSLWPVVWEPSVMTWPDYELVFQPGVRSLLFRMKISAEHPLHPDVPCRFELKQGVKLDQLRQLLAATNASPETPSAVEVTSEQDCINSKAAVTSGHRILVTAQQVEA